ncbi:MAG: translation initiation factor IF-3 C-terminal domain-containing protein, partial [Ignavibacteriaceae bacterium]|nr:translation initiation factor IF-3 C-terminal domain-containing protein [Ignavibacteriaceae bacterium]
TKHAINFLEEGNKVEATVMLKGREMAYVDKGEELLNRFIEKVKEIGKIEMEPKLEGRNMSLIVVPISKKGKKKQQKTEK